MESDYWFNLIKTRFDLNTNGWSTDLVLFSSYERWAIYYYSYDCSRLFVVHLCETDVGFRIRNTVGEICSTCREEIPDAVLDTIELIKL